MLGLTKKTDYALIALAYLARRRDSLVSAREIARATRMPLPILTNVLKTLAGEGIVASERGAHGGYGLAHAAHGISLFDLIGAVEGPVQFVQCADREPGAADSTDARDTCSLEPCCLIRRSALRVHERFREFLRSVSLAELLDDGPTPMLVSPASSLVVEQRASVG